MAIYDRRSSEGLIGWFMPCLIRLCEGSYVLSFVFGLPENVNDRMTAC